MEVLSVKKIINYIIIYILDFIISANICYNLTHIIKNNIKLEWNLNVFHSFIELIEELLNNSLSYNQLKNSSFDIQI